MKSLAWAWAAVGVVVVGSSLAQAQSAPSPQQIVRIRLGADMVQPTSGRLLVFAQPWAEAAGQGADVKAVDNNEMSPKAVFVAARELDHLAPGATADIDTDETAFPAGFSHLAPGDYAVQAVLDPMHSYAYAGRTAGDVISNVVKVRLPVADVTLTLNHLVPAAAPWELPPSAAQALRDAVPAARQAAQPIDFTSPVLSAFWGRPIHMRGWVLTPPGYAAHPNERYPTVYWTHGFGGNLDRISGAVVAVNAGMAAGEMAPMIWVFLDQSSPTGTHEFADGVNNGPWGQALTTELIPDLERRYRMDARPTGRFLTGHSSGGWATLWLQIRYPKLFGATWSTSPDSSDFHDFTGPDIYAPRANVYRKADGTPWPLVRDKGKVIATFQEFAQLEAVLGAYGGQMTSFDWVFSPKGQDGRPLPMFDRATGDVDPAVALYWRDHYDIAYRLQTGWRALKSDLDGKIHLIVGTADTFYLDGAAHRLKAVLDGLGARSDIRFLPGKTHMDLYAEGADRLALLQGLRKVWEGARVPAVSEA